jgi:hypothetical protein
MHSDLNSFTDGQACSTSDPAKLCSLPPSDVPSRLERWRAVLASGSIERNGPGERVIVFSHTDAVLARELHALAALERNCCGGLDWRVDEDARGLVLRIGGSEAMLNGLVAMLTACAP